MRTAITAFFAIAALSLLFSQEVELFADYNLGAEDSFSNWNYQGIEFNGKLILPIIDSNLGEELGVIENGELRVLKDIYEGGEGSLPFGFTIYKSELYFTAVDEVNGAAIWKTDGTEVGTMMFFDPGESQWSEPRYYIKAENGWLYYGYGEKIFRTDGEVNEELETESSLLHEFNYDSSNYCKYKDGIAILHKNDDYSFSIYYIDGDQETKLGTTQETEFFADGYSLLPVSNGLSFTINDSDVDGIYVYDEDAESIERISVGWNYISSRRTINLSDERNICFFFGEGAYSINGIEGEEEALHESPELSFLAGFPVLHGKYLENACFVYDEGTFGENYLIHTNGFESGTTIIKELKPYQSEMIVYNKYGFIAEGVSNGFEPILSKVDLVTGEVESIYNFEESSNVIGSVRPIAVLDDYLYFLSGLDPTVGMEMYRIKLDLMVSLADTEKNELSILQHDNQFVVKSTSGNEIDVSIYNTVGQNVGHVKTRSNEMFQLNLSEGCYFLHVTAQNNSHTKLVFIRS